MSTVTERQRSRRADLRANGYVETTVAVRREQVPRLQAFARACNAGQPIGLRLLPALNRLRALLPDLAGDGVARAGVFGSTARGEDTPDSDLDVVLVLRDNAKLDLMSVVGLKDRVATALAAALDGAEVDVAIRAHMRDDVRAAVDREAIYAD